MCGIAGFLIHGNQKTNFSFDIQNMMNKISHRGPDDEGFWIDEKSRIALGHRRLSILDLTKAGHQPMHSDCSRYVLIFNGEIYNHLKIRENLQSLNEQKVTHWRGSSDTETLLAAIAEWGIKKTLRNCVGMFSIAIWDKKKKLLTLARDRLGEKPLYYGWHKDTFMFGSELKALRSHPHFIDEIDRSSLTLFLRYNYVPSPFSIYKGIKKLTPGNFVQVSLDDKSNSVIPYWSLEEIAIKGQNNTLNLSDDEACNLLNKSLGDAVEQQQVADVPLGAFLSGGVDSSLIVSLMQDRSTRPVKTFSIGFSESDFNEAKYAKAVAKHLGTDHSELYVSPAEAISVIPDLPIFYDEPFADSSQIPTFLVAKMASKDVKVSLSGDGGDELFGGYNRYVWSRSIYKKTNWLPKSSLNLISSAIQSVSPDNWDKFNNLCTSVLPTKFRTSQMGDKMHKVASIMDFNSYWELYHGLVSQWSNPLDIVINGDESKMHPISKGIQSFDSDIEHFMMFADSKTYLPDDILCKVDRASMAVGLETRVPLLNHNIVELSWQLPLNMKIRDGKSKWLLRELLSRYVPNSLINRPKQGFALPIASWLRGPLREWAEELLDESRIKNEGYFNPEPIQNAWKDHLNGKNMQNKLWGILMFQAWLNNRG